MRRTVFVLLAALVSVASSQWLETIVRLPDTFPPWDICYCSGVNKVLCVGGNRVLVIDGLTNTLTATISVEPAGDRLIYNPDTRRAFCAHEYWRGPLTVIDVDGDSVLRALPVPGGNHMSLCHNPHDNKVYYAHDLGASDSCLYVVDGSGDSIIANLAAGGSQGLCYNPANNSVYCSESGRDRVAVVDGDTNAIRRYVQVGDFPTELGVCPRYNRVFCANLIGASLTVIDGHADTVLRTVATSNQQVISCHDGIRHRVYCPVSEQDLYAIDCRTGVAVETMHVSSSWMGAMHHNSVNDRVYIPYYGRMTILDPSTGNVDSVIEVPGWRGGGLVAWDSVQNKTFWCVDSADSSSIHYAIAVLRDSGGGVEESREPQAVGRKQEASVVRGVLVLPQASSRKPQATSLLDASGREVMELQAGPNDVRSLAPGVYFARRATGEGRVANSKVIVTR